MIIPEIETIFTESCDFLHQDGNIVWITSEKAKTAAFIKFGEDAYGSDLFIANVQFAGK